MTESSRTVQPEKTTVTPSFPTGRVKKIMKLDKDISKINAEALFLVSCSADLFLSFLSDISSSVSASFNRRTVSLDHFRAAVSAHRPTSDFLLDSLPKASLPAHHNNYKKKVDDDVQEQQLPRGTQKIDRFFSKTGV